MSDEIRPFQIAATDEVLDDLRARLHNTRWPDPEVVDDWSQGTPQGYLQEVCRYWADTYDWRAVEARMNAYDHYKVDIDGIPIHFQRVPGKGPNPMPLVLTHGWPWTFWDLHKVVDALADPGAHGGDPADAFDRDPHGGPLLPRPLHDIPADTRRAIQSVKVRRRRIAGGGDEVYEVEEVEYKFADKAAANKALGKRLGYDETDAQTGGGGGVIEIPENGRDTPAGG